MESNLTQIVAGIRPTDLKDFLIAVDRYPDKSPRVWQQIGMLLGGRYAASHLEQVYESLCSLLGEPPNTTTLSLRVAYEMPLTPEQLKLLPFMNLGYHSTPEAPPSEEFELADSDRKHRCNLALYRLWLTKAQIEGRDLVEVGSGRGGGGAFLARYFKPRSYVGVDGSRTQVALCRDAYPSLRFLHGLASALPLQDSCADWVINVESSHCYSDLNQFFAEVHRILRPGGKFVLTDVLYRKSQVFLYLKLLERRFRIKAKVDITNNVVACLKSHGVDQFLQYLDAMGTNRPRDHELVLTAARVYLPLMDDAPFANYRALSIGEALYVSFLCEKGD